MGKGRKPKVLLRPRILTPVDDKTRNRYRGFAYGFIGVGVGFAAVSVAQALLGFEFFNGNPLPVALLVSAIGVGLLFTVRGAGEPPETPEE